MSVKLPADVHTPDQLSATVLDVRAYNAAMHDSIVRGHISHTKPEPPSISELLSTLISGNNIDLQDSRALDELAKELERLLTKAPVAHITLAALPGRGLRREITQWFRTNIDPHMLLTFTARGDLGAGLVLQTGSRLYDFTFRRRILDNKKRIAEIAGV